MAKHSTTERNYLGLPNKQPSHIPTPAGGKTSLLPSNKPSSSANEKPSLLKPFLSSNELSFFLYLLLPFLVLPSFYKSCPCCATPQSICQMRCYWLHELFKKNLVRSSNVLREDFCFLTNSREVLAFVFCSL